MNADDLFAQRTCPRCGGSYSKAVSFCPHCGYVRERSWLDDLTDLVGGRTAARGTSSQLISALVGGLVGFYLLADAIAKGSLVGILVAAIPLGLAVRAWLLSRRTGEEPSAVHYHEEEILESDEKADEVATFQKFFCENCGTEVAEDASQCPKCGMKFG